MSRGVKYGDISRPSSSDWDRIVESSNRKFEKLVEMLCESCDTMPEEAISKFANSKQAMYITNSLLKVSYILHMNIRWFSGLSRSYEDATTEKERQQILLEEDEYLSMVAEEYGLTQSERKELNGLWPAKTTVAQCRDALTATYTANYQKLSYNYRIDNRDNRLSELFSMVILSMNLSIFLLLPEEAKNEMENCCAVHIPYLLKNNLAVSNRPILEYRMSELLRAMRQLCARWIYLQYSAEILRYMDLLYVRLGLYLNFSYPGWLHDVKQVRVSADPVEELKKTRGLSRDESEDIQDQENYLKEVLGEESSDDAAEIVTKNSKQKNFNSSATTTPDDPLYKEYQCSPRIKQMLAPMLNALFAKLQQLYIGNRVRVDPYINPIAEDIPNDVQVRTLKKWITDKMTGMHVDGVSALVRANYIKLNMRPGEKETFKVEYPEEVLTDQSVLRKYRGNEYFHLGAMAERSIQEVFDAEMDVEPEPIGLWLALTEFIGRYIKATYHHLNWSDFVIMEKDLSVRSDDIDNIKYPCLLQAFNHWQLHYHGSIYWYDSYLRAVVAWMFIIERDFNCEVNKINIRPWFEELVKTGEEMLEEETRKRMQKERIKTLKHRLAMKQLEEAKSLRKRKALIETEGDSDYEEGNDISEARQHYLRILANEDSEDEGEDDEEDQNNNNDASSATSGSSSLLSAALSSRSSLSKSKQKSMSLMEYQTTAGSKAQEKQQQLTSEEITIMRRAAREKIVHKKTIKASLNEAAQQQSTGHNNGKTPKKPRTNEEILKELKAAETDPFFIPSASMMQRVTKDDGHKGLSLKNAKDEAERRQLQAKQLNTKRKVDSVF